MIEGYLAFVALTYAACALRMYTQRTPRPTYKVWTTWTPKVHVATSWADAHEWVGAYARVECQVFINGERVR